MTATFTLTGTLYHQDGVTPAAGSGIKARATAIPDPANSRFYTHGVSTTTDANGHFSLTLVTGPTGLNYRVKSLAKVPLFDTINVPQQAVGGSIDISDPSLTTYSPDPLPLLSQMLSIQASVHADAVAVAGATITDNGDGTATVGSAVAITDNGGGTATI